MIINVVTYINEIFVLVVYHRPRIYFTPESKQTLNRCFRFWNRKIPTLLKLVPHSCLKLFKWGRDRDWGSGYFTRTLFPRRFFFQIQIKGKGFASNFLIIKPESQIINSFETSKSFDRSIDQSIERERERERERESL